MPFAARRTLAPLAALVIAAACASTGGTGERPALSGTAWVLASLPGRTLVTAPRTPTLRFDDSTASGSDGCNGYGASYTLADGAFTFGERMPSTMMACDDPVMEQGRALAEAVLGATSYRVTEGRLELLSANGDVRVSFTPQPASLAGTSWRVTGYNTGSQAVRSVIAGTTLTMAFGTDGRVTGSAGCNNYFGPYTHEADRLTLGPAAATKKACLQPEGAMEQEQQFLAALGTVATVRLEGNRARLQAADGSTALTLERQ
jgi:heat shock protein HslJ